MQGSLGEVAEGLCEEGVACCARKAVHPAGSMYVLCMAAAAEYRRMAQASGGQAPAPSCSSDGCSADSGGGGFWNVFASTRS